MSSLCGVDFVSRSRCRCAEMRWSIHFESRPLGAVPVFRAISSRRTARHNEVMDDVGHRPADDRDRGNTHRVRALPDLALSRAGSGAADGNGSRGVDVRDGLALVAHEIRAYLGGTKGFALTLRDHAEDMSPQDRAAAYEALVRCSDALSALAENLLDLDRVDDGKLELRTSGVNLGQIIREVVDETGRTFPGTPFTVSMSGENLEVLGDPVALARVLGNLLRNAVRHGSTGAAVGIEAVRVLDSVIVSVRNEGDRIPTDVRARFFQRFGSADRGGIGLGLYLCRVIVEAHGGKIWFADDDGNRFEFMLPLAAADAPVSAG